MSDPDPTVVLSYPPELKHQESKTVEQKLAPVVRDYAELLEHLPSGSSRTLVVTTGYFNPLHKNHISNIVSSKHLPEALLKEHSLSADVHLTVVINGDWAARDKLGGEVFMAAEHRADVVRAIAGVDLVFIHEVETHHQGALIELGAFHILTKGGDRDFASLPKEEQAALAKTDTIVISDVGDPKFANTEKEISSSKLRAAAKGDN